MDLNTLNSLGDNSDLNGIESLGIVVLIVSIVFTILIIALLIYSAVRKQIAINAILRIDKNIQKISEQFTKK